MFRLIYISLLAAALGGCATSAPYVSYQAGGIAKPEGCPINVYAEGLELHRKTVVLGEMQISDTGFSTNCGSEVAIKQFKSKACSIGADAFQLYNVRLPNIMSSTCYQAGARFLRYTETQD